MMNKIKLTILVMILSIGMLAGCGASYAADESTVFVRKDGSVVSTDVEKFDENTYEQDGLKTYVEEAISSYNSEYGKGMVKLKNLSVKDSKAVLTIEYNSAADYQRFNEIDFFTGSVAEALAAGYAFDVDFASVSDGKAVSCDVDEFLNDASYKVVIIRGNTNVKVKGSIAYVSAVNTNYVDSQTIAIKEGTSVFGQENVIQGTEEATEVEGTEAQTEALEADGAVSDDELLNVGEEDTEMIFQFDEEDTDSDGGSEFSQVYTYIVYK